MIAAALALVLTLSLGAQAQDSDESSALLVAKKLIAAFNQHDAAAMARLVTSDFELYYVDLEGRASLAASSSSDLERDMVGYFASRPSVRSEINGVIDGPNFVSFREQIVGGQSSLAVYEVREGLIRRAWYFPAENEQPNTAE